MGAKLFTGLAALSLLLLLTAAALMVRSFWVHDSFDHRRVDEARLTTLTDGFSLYKGYAVFGSVRTTYRDPKNFDNVMYRWNPPVTEGWSRMTLPIDPQGSWARFGERPGEREFLGIGHQHKDYSGTRDITWRRTVVLPPWLLIAPWVVLPAIWLRGWWGRRYARRPGLCARCGYDLRATPGRCPECGASAGERESTAATQGPVVPA